MNPSSLPEKTKARFTWIRLRGAPFRLAQASIRLPISGIESGWGRDPNSSVARAKAIGEVLERFAFRVPIGLIQEKPDEVPNSVDPRTLVCYSRRQYQNKSFPFRPFQSGRCYLWTKATEFVDGTEASILAEFVYSRHALGSEYRDAAYTSISTSGSATGSSVKTAMHRAVLELVERDAFMRHWFAQYGGLGIRLESLPRRQQERIEALSATGCRVSIQELASPFAYVCLAMVQHGDQRFTCVGAGASLKPEKAIESALGEAETMAYSRLQNPRAPRIEPKDVCRPEDHSNLYAQPKYFRKADRLFLLKGWTRLPTSTKQFPKSPDTLVERLRGRFGRVFWVDLTVPGIAHKYGRNLKTVRAIVPGLIPLTFGYGTMPMGMVSRKHPGCVFPHPFA